MILEELKKCLKNELKDKTIFDIVVYGSLVKGKMDPNDLDIVIIFKQGSLNERLERLQQIKKKIRLKEKVDIKGILWEELFQEGFFGRTGIFLEGISLINEKPFSYKMGFEGFAIFVYNLKNKSHTEKVKFNYLLNGRDRDGLIKMMGGKHLGAGVIQIPISRSLEFDEVLKRHNIQYSKIDNLIMR